MSKYRSTPDETRHMPKGIKYIVGNEAAERFSYYGMRTILVVFMTKYLVDSEGAFDTMSDAEARAWYATFNTAAYFMPALGALISDLLLGKYRTILYLSLAYCFGHLALALDETRLGLTIGLTLIAIGAGGIKPCVSAHVGDQFGQSNKHLLEKVYNWFYFSINLGAFASSVATPIFLDEYGPAVAFGVPGGLMLLATIVFWMGRTVFIHVPPQPKKFTNEAFSREGIALILRFSVIVVFVAIFWSLYDQSGAAWVLQADRMDRRLGFLGLEPLPSQIQAINPILILVMIPLFAFVIYPLIDKIYPLTALRKIGLGFFFAAGAFAISAVAESKIDGGEVFRVTSHALRDHAPRGLNDDNGEEGRPTDGWSSDGQPTEEAPQEIILRLRERKAWPVGLVQLSGPQPPTYVELESKLDSEIEDRERALQNARATKDESVDTAKLESEVTQLTAALDKLSKDSVDPAVVSGALRNVGSDPDDIDPRRQAPREVHVLAGDFSESPIPAESELPYSDRVEAYVAAGWTWIGSIASEDVNNDPEWLESVEGAEVQATHVMVVIGSNHGAERVELSEISVFAAADNGRGQDVSSIGDAPSVWWQILAFIVLTAAEVMISITCLEFFYAYSPKTMKSVMMALFYSSVSLGNVVVAAVNFFIQRDDGRTALEGASYYWFFVGLALVAGVLFVPVAERFKGKRYIQGEDEEREIDAEADAEGSAH